MCVKAYAGPARLVGRRLSGVQASPATVASRTGRPRAPTRQGPNWQALLRLGGPRVVGWVPRCLGAVQAGDQRAQCREFLVEGLGALGGKA